MAEPVRRGPRYRVRADRSRLTPRELEVAGHISHGLRNLEIAVELHLSPYTVAQHVASILERTHTKTRAHAVATLLRAGFLV